MRKVKAIALSILVILLTMIFTIPFSVSANGPAPNPELIVELRNLPKGTAYVDIAILAPEDQIVNLAQNPPEGVSKESPFVRGQYGEFVSYSFRIQSAQSTIVPDEYGCVSFSDPELIHDGKKIRIVLADENGEILKLSDPVNITPRGFFDYSLNSLEYDAAADDVLVKTGYSSWFFILYVLTSVAGIILTCFSELLVGAAFKLMKSHGKLIAVTNVVSQIAMRELFVILYSFMPQYILLTVLLEVLVYTGEFVIYRILARDVPMSKCLLYVFTANTVSLVLGLLLNLYMW